MLSERAIQNCEKAQTFKGCEKKENLEEGTEEEELEKEKTRRGKDFEKEEGVKSDKCYREILQGKDQSVPSIQQQSSLVTLGREISGRKFFEPLVKIMILCLVLVLDRKLLQVNNYIINLLSPINSSQCLIFDMQLINVWKDGQKDWVDELDGWTQGKKKDEGGRKISWEEKEKIKEGRKEIS